MLDLGHGLNDRTSRSPSSKGDEEDPENDTGEVQLFIATHATVHQERNDNDTAHCANNCNYKDNEEMDVDKVLTYPLWGSCRLTLVLFCFFGDFLIYFLRFGFTMALISMVGPTASQGDRNHTTGNMSSEMDDKMGEFHHWDKNTQAQLLSAYYYGYLIPQIWSGWMSDRYGGKMLLLFGMTTKGLLQLSIPMLARLSSRYVWLARAVQGLMGGIAMPAVYNSFSTWSSPEEKTTLMNLAYAGGHIGLITNFPVTALLCSSGIDRGLAVLLWCALFFHLCTDRPESHPRISKGELQYLKRMSCRNRSMHGRDPLKVSPFPVWQALTSVPLLALTFQHFTANWGFCTMSINLPLFVDEVVKLDIIQNGIASSIPYIGVFLVSFSGRVFDWIIKKGGVSVNTLRKISNTIGQLTPAFLLLLMPYFSSLAQLCLLFVSIAVTQLTFSAGFLLSHMDLGGQFAGILYGITNTVGNLGGIFTPPVVASLAPNGTAEEWQNVFYICSAVNIVGALVYLIFGTSKLQEWAKPKEDIKEEHT